MSAEDVRLPDPEWSYPAGKGQDLIEQLADLEHQQWAHWTRYMLDNLTMENVERWRRQCDTPYAELTEREKDSDREWAHKAYALCDLEWSVRAIEAEEERDILHDLLAGITP